jgi:hypothetical protein
MAVKARAEVNRLGRLAAKAHTACTETSAIECTTRTKTTTQATPAATAICASAKAATTESSAAAQTAA